MIYKLHFANELDEAVLYDAASTDNIAGIFTEAKDKIIVFSASYDKMVAVCKDVGVPWRFIRRYGYDQVVIIPRGAYFVKLWGFYGNLILAKFDNVQMSLFPDMPEFEFKEYGMK